MSATLNQEALTMSFKAAFRLVAPALASLALLLSSVAGCHSDSGGTTSKAEARLLGGQTANGEDMCAMNGWYGDGVCDRFCPQPDGDCDAPGARDNPAQATPCTSDADCGAGQVCSSDINACAQACTTSSDCRAGELCSPYTHACGVACTRSRLTVCPAGQFCPDDGSPVCIAAPPYSPPDPCVDDTECDPTQVCTNGACTAP
jgi:Cys-rich repeat protein